MINMSKKKKRRKKQNKSNPQGTTTNDDHQNIRAAKQVTRDSIQRLDPKRPASRTIHGDSSIHDDSSSSSCCSADLKETIHNEDEDSFEVMVNSGSEIVNLARQAKLYKSSKQEEICTDTVLCIQRYLKNIFRQVR